MHVANFVARFLACHRCDGYRYRPGSCRAPNLYIMGITAFLVKEVCSYVCFCNQDYVRIPCLPCSGANVLRNRPSDNHCLSILYSSVPLTALRLFYITQALGSSDRTYELFTATVVTQVGMNVSIIVTCIPFVKQFLDHIQPGWSTSDIRTGLGYNTIMGRSGKDYPMGSVVKSANHTNTTDIQKTGQPWSEDGILESRTFTATIEPRAPTPGGSVLEGTKLRQTIGCIMHSEPADTV